jgi:hypothetical protein
LGQGSNSLTLRKNKEELNGQFLHLKEYLETVEYTKVLKRSLIKKGITITFSNFNIKYKTTSFYLNLFYGTKTLLNYKKRLKKKYIKKQKNNIFKNSLIKNKLILLNFKLMNKNINKKISINLNENFKRFKNKLFSRRFNLFFDFIKMSSLFIQKKINSETYLIIIGNIFKILPKRMHSQFFFFLKKLIPTLISNKESEIKGLKLRINGKLKGKLRSSSYTISKGKIETQTLSSNIDFSKQPIFTMYGCFGFKF